MTLPITKVGIIPYRHEHGEVEFLLHKPKPKHNPEDDIAFGLCRGTRRYREDDTWVDAREPEALSFAQREKLESLSSTAFNEAEEELGLSKSMVRQIIELGPLPYNSANNPAYPVHWFLAEVKPDTQLDTPQDAADTAWKGLAETQSMAQEGDFKLGYLSVLEKALKMVEADLMPHAHGPNCDCAQHSH